MNSAIRQLAIDTLYDRKDEKDDVPKTCFVVNEAGQQLRLCSADAIPILEEFIRDLVVPAMAEYREKNGIPDPNAIFREGPPFGGLNSFLGAYWIICARTDARRAIQFMNEMPRPVISESVSKLPVFFNAKHPLSDVEIPKEYVDYLNALRESEVQEFNDIAAWALEKLGLSESKA